MSFIVNKNREQEFVVCFQQSLGLQLNLSSCFFQILFLYSFKGSVSAKDANSNMGIKGNRICSNNLFKIFSENFSTSVFTFILSSSVSDIGRVLVSFDTSIL
uniref:Uncharacterized protein n=1 Tax=Cacopsylla melanoneura TaxID=428564 RepID=A0A8D8SJD5_9HEMI